MAYLLKGSTLGRVTYERILHVMEHFHLKSRSSAKGDCAKDLDYNTDYVTGANSKEKEHISWLKVNGVYRKFKL